MANGDSRLPSNLQGLLKFCLTETKGEDAPSERIIAPMDDERRAFLEAALQQMHAHDPIKTMVRHIETAASTHNSLEERQDALEEMQELCEDMNFACDFHKIGGFTVSLALLHDQDGDMRWQACDLLATCVQNNPYCQSELLKLEAVPKLLNLLDTDPEVMVKVKALYALSSLCRGHADCHAEFVARDGFSVLLRALQCDSEKLQTKTAFMVGVMCTEQPECRDGLVAQGYVAQLAALVARPHSRAHDQLLAALAHLVRDHGAGLAEAGRAELQLTDTLSAIKGQLGGAAEHEEEVENIECLLALLATTGSVDR